MISRQSEKLLNPKVPVLILLFGLFSAVGIAQVDIPSDLVPPPLTKLSKKTLDSLKAEKSLKGRTKLAISLMEARLTTSASLTGESKYNAALNAVGTFEGLMLNTKRALLNRRERPSFKNNKRFEIALRKFIPDLERIKRELPFRYGYHIGRLIKDVEDVREELLDSFFAQAN